MLRRCCVLNRVAEPCNLETPLAVSANYHVLWKRCGATQPAERR